MKTSLLAASAAAVLLTSGAVLAQNSGQDVVPSARHQNSAHQNAPGTPDQTNSGAMQGQPGGMENTATGQNGRGNDMDMNAGGNTRSNENGMRNDQMGRDRMRVNETGNRTRVRLTTTQRTRIKNVIVRAHGPRLTRVNFRIGVGARIPPTVHVAVLPPEIVAIAPEWQGYSYFEYGDQIVIVDPATFAIVATLPL